jgi:hypothetical protein
MYMSVLIMTKEVDEVNVYAIKICEKCGRYMRKYDKCDCEIIGWTLTSNPIRNNSRYQAKR